MFLFITDLVYTPIVDRVKIFMYGCLKSYEPYLKKCFFPLKTILPAQFTRAGATIYLAF